jgi:hydroxymethylpyrimidine pyrophosphatase-like HAD family hydrolase
MSNAPRRSVDELEMFAPAALDSVPERHAQEGVLPTELEFYESYGWCLNPYLTVNEAIRRLRSELTRLVVVPHGWQLSEVTTNIFLLSCGLLNSVDEYLRGPALRLPPRLAASIFGRGAAIFVETISYKPWSRRQVSRWRDHWHASLNNFLLLIVREQAVESARLAEAGRELMLLLESPLPSGLLSELLGTPTPFNRLDLTQKDCLALGESFVRQFPKRDQPILLVGLRTSGSYFAPLLRAYFEAEGYEIVALLTIEPNKGVSRREKGKLKEFAARGYLALIVDDPPDTSRTVLAALDIASRVGFARDRVKFVAPTHPAKPAWFKMLAKDSVITLRPEQWHKRQLLSPKVVEARLTEYFLDRNFVRASVTSSPIAEKFNADLESTVSDERGGRLKRIFEVELVTPEGEKQTKYVLAKSVGWGWLGYHAFLIGHRLHGYVPPILGLREGILYMEWIPQPPVEHGGERTELVEASASYVAARVRHLSLTQKDDSESSLDLKRYNNGIRLLAKALSRAYGRVLTDLLMRSRLGEEVRKQRCPCPTLIDGNMNCNEWIIGPRGQLKTDYEHHGMGKAALNLTDPAYDLADTILNLALSSEEERNLVNQYVAVCGDTTVERRLFIHKLLAGLWSLNQVQQQLFAPPRGGDVQRAYHRRFMNAWNFLTVQTARHCGSLCHPRIDLRWRAPLVMLDVDGVLDRRLFGFPCTTAAGMKALSLLSAHEYSVALNTARSAPEVKDYCKAYSLAGGVAEHGSYLWDAVRQRERILISAETVRQLEVLRHHLKAIPGVFLDERHQYSIRAFTYREKPLGLIQSLLSSTGSSSIGDGALAPISTHIVQQLLVDLRLDRLAFHHTMIDTAVVAKEADKGTGLVALRDWVLAEDAETIAIGDGEPDLAMFRVASRSFAPANISCGRQARLLGCQFVSYPYQRGLLEIVRKIIHPDAVPCERCGDVEKFSNGGDDLFLSVLKAADQSWTANLFSAILDPTAFRIFIR